MSFQKAAGFEKIPAFRVTSRRRNHSSAEEEAPQELSEVDKQRNRAISKERVEVEHQIGGIKRCNILVHPLRSRTDQFADDVMETACGLDNFRLSHRKLKAA